MIRFLPYILIPILIIAGLGYWRLTASKQSSTPSLQNSQTVQDSSPMEVPKTLPGASLEDRVKSLEDAVTKLVTQFNNFKLSGQTDVPNLSSRLSNAEAAVTDLKARVSALEKAGPTTTTTTSSNKYPLYIPLGAGGGPWGSQDWATLTEYQATINSDNYPGYSGMQLEVNFRLVESAGTGSVRLYNVTDGSSISSQVDTTGTSFGLQTTNSFKLPGGQKTYSIQVKSSQGKDLFVQSARVKVSF